MSNATQDVETRLRDALQWLERNGSKRLRDGYARYGITATNPFGVSMAKIQALAKRLGRDHALAVALWDTNRYEARLLTAFVAEPERVTAKQMDRWARDFDNWGICDTLCFKLFDRTPHAWRKVEQWITRREEFVKRAGCALLASLALHDKGTADEPFLRMLPAVERAAGDERNFVKKGASWAMRSIGRRSAALNAATIESARRLSNADSPAARWVGKDVLRELTSPAVQRRLVRARKVPKKL